MRICRLLLKRLLAAGLLLQLHAEGLWLSLWKRRPTLPHDAWACTSTLQQEAEVRKQAFRYSAQYCEENIWQLCEDLLRGRPDGGTGYLRGRSYFPVNFLGSGGRKGLGDRLKVVVISNDEQCVPFWNQRAGKPCRKTGKPGFVTWDYHVFAILEAQGPQSRTKVYDLDADLKPFPLPFEDYVEEVLGPRCVDLADCPRDRYFRVVEAEDYLDCLCSDRSHMQDEAGRYRATPPAEPPIIGARNRMGGRSTNLFSDFVSMDREVGVGKVLGEQAFLRRFSGRSRR